MDAATLLVYLVAAPRGRRFRDQDARGKRGKIKTALDLCKPSSQLLGVSICRLDAMSLLIDVAGRERPLSLK